LQEVELHEGLREIGEHAFQYCSALDGLQVTDGVKSIGDGAFYRCTSLEKVHKCNFTKFNCPPLVTQSRTVCSNIRQLFSLEVSQNITRVQQQAFRGCESLRNIALSSNTAVADEEEEYHPFRNCKDLLHIFGSIEAIVNALKIRFVKLPVHSSVYYKSPHNTMTSEGIRNIITNGENGERDPSGLQQDCLGMTPLHILACSTVQCLELYQLMVDKYPNNLIVEDAWGATPLLYAIWGDAPSEIVEFLMNSYQSLYPDYEFDWTFMVVTLGRANSSKGVIQNLIHVQQTYSLGQTINWPMALMELARTFCEVSPKIFCFLTRCSIATRVNAIGVKHFRDAMDDDWKGSDYNFNRQEWHIETLTKLEYYESEYQKLKESTSLLELALWKARIDDSSMNHGKAMDAGNKKVKIDPSEFRLQCRISCGAVHVIENVLPYILPSDYMSSYVPDKDDNNENDNDHGYYSDEL
jgi:hypothetical protein